MNIEPAISSRRFFRHEFFRAGRNSEMNPRAIQAGLNFFQFANRKINRS
jgi:hypothetical protein